MLLLDTDICIDLMRGRKPAPILDLVDGEAVAASTITVHELVEGARRSARPRRSRQRVDRFLEPFELLPFDPTMAWISGSLAGDLMRAGAPIGDLDTLIAATALHHGIPVVTRNARHFETVPGLDVLAP